MQWVFQLFIPMSGKQGHKWAQSMLMGTMQGSWDADPPTGSSRFLGVLGDGAGGACREMDAGLESSNEAGVGQEFT